MYETSFYCEDEDKVAITPDAIYVSVLDSEETVLIDQATPTLVSTGHYSYEYDGETGESYIFRWEVTFNNEVVILDDYTSVASGDVDSITTFNAELISEDETFKVGSYGETVKFQLSKQDSTLLDISGTEVIMLMEIQSRSYSFNMTIDDGESGIVSYTFEDGDLDKSGYAHVEIELDTLTKKLISENSVSLVIKNRV